MFFQTLLPGDFLRNYPIPVQLKKNTHPSLMIFVCGLGHFNPNEILWIWEGTGLALLWVGLGDLGRSLPAWIIP